MHDVISDILANDAVPRDRKRAEILLAERRFRDDSSYVMSLAAWQTMTRHMGVENMGGPAVGFLPALPTPTVTYGAVMTHDDRTGEMTGFTHGSATGGAHMGHDMPDSTRGSTPPGAHQGHMAPPPDSTRGVPPGHGHAGHGTPPPVRPPERARPD
jgi:hypothetical protein